MRDVDQIIAAWRAYVDLIDPHLPHPHVRDEAEIARRFEALRLLITLS